MQMFCEKRSNYVKVWHASITKDLQFEKMHRKLSRFLSYGEISQVPLGPKEWETVNKRAFGLVINSLLRAI